MAYTLCKYGSLVAAISSDFSNLAPFQYVSQKLSLGTLEALRSGPLLTIPP